MYLLLLSVIFAFHGLKEWGNTAKAQWQGVMQANGGQTWPSEERVQAYRKLSAVLPRDAAILTRLDQPFLLSFRPDVYIADYPGGASPPPGLPYKQGPEALRQYLLSLGVGYLAWDYQTQAGFSKAAYGDRLLPTEHPWIRSEALNTFDFQDNLELLRKTRPLVYDGDGLVIIDLR